MVIAALRRIRRLEEREAQRKAEEAIMEERRRQLLEEADGYVASVVQCYSKLTSPQHASYIACCVQLLAANRRTVRILHSTPIMQQHQHIVTFC